MWGQAICNLGSGLAFCACSYKRNIYFYNVITSPESAWQSAAASIAWQSLKRVEIATFPSVTRNDNLLYEIVQLVPSKAKESSSVLAMTLE